MLGTQDLPLFVLSGLLLNLTPGPDTLYIVGRSTIQGWRAGAVAAPGIGAGILVHIFAAAIGLSAILAASTAAFTVVKIAGALYLIYVGISLLATGPSQHRLPQFVDPAAPSKATAFLFLGLVFNFNGTLWNLFVAWSCARIGGGLMRSTSFARWFNRCVGGLFVWLGLKLALDSGESRWG